MATSEEEFDAHEAEFEWVDVAQILHEVDSTRPHAEGDRSIQS